MLKKIVLTGALGDLGSVLRAPLAAMAEALVSVDIKDPPAELAANETYVQADLAGMEAAAKVIEGATMVVHFAAIPDERPFEELLGPNFVAAYNVWEASRRAGVRRIVYASSVHAIGMWETNAGIGLDAPHRPDTFYGLSKCFVEDMGRMYWEKTGLESVHLRIFSATEAPANVRSLGTWLSRPDLIQMVERAVETPVTGFAVVYGVSNNDRAPVDNRLAAFLGYRPKDNAEFRAREILAAEPVRDPKDPAHSRLGGPFAAVPLGESGVAWIRKLTDG
jgi:uronate dehydrogenase